MEKSGGSRPKAQRRRACEPDVDDHELTIRTGAGPIANLHPRAKTCLKGVDAAMEDR